MKNDNIIISEKVLKLLKKSDFQDITLGIVLKNLNLKNKKKYLMNQDKYILLKYINEYFDYRIRLIKNEIERSSKRDMVFEIIMMRFDLLNENKVAVTKLFKILKKNPKRFIFLLPSFIYSMSLMLKIVGIQTKGVSGRIKLKGLLVVYFSTFLTWVKDKSLSLDKTMTMLDKNLNRAESILKLLKV